MAQPQATATTLQLHLAAEKQTQLQVNSYAEISDMLACTCPGWKAGFCRLYRLPQPEQNREGNYTIDSGEAVAGDLVLEVLLVAVRRT
jgi:hypothetical protein